MFGSRSTVSHQFAVELKMMMMMMSRSLYGWILLAADFSRRHREGEGRDGDGGGGGGVSEGNGCRALGTLEPEGRVKRWCRVE